MNTLITALVGLLGVVAGGVVKGYWEREVAVEKHRSESAMAKQSFESDLILRALQAENTEERTKSLKFLVKTNLITEPKVREGVMALIKDPNNIPQFFVGATPPQSAREQFLSQHTELQDSHLVLTGFDVRHGDVVDALTPIFSVLKPNLTFGEQKRGQRAGGDGGAAVTIEQEGYIITGIDTYRGTYFGADHLIQIQLRWHKLTSLGIDPSDSVVSEKLGSGNHAENVIVEKFRVAPGAYISDYQISTSLHSDGTHYVGDIDIQQSKL